MKDSFELLADQMQTDHERPEKHRAWGCLILAAFVMAVFCSGGCLGVIATLFLRGSWWD